MRNGETVLSRDFLVDFKRQTEKRWRNKELDTSCYGLQFQRGTRWNAGLSANEILEYERILQVRFPLDFKTFLGEMNGTDLATLNVYGSGHEARHEDAGVYSYPRDIELVQGLMKAVRVHRQEIAADLAEQGFELHSDIGLVPIFSHRYIVCSADSSNSAVLSIVLNGVDAIVYGKSLMEYLEKEFLGGPA